MKFFYRFIIGLLFVSGLLICLTGCQANTSEDTLEVNIGYFPNITHAQALILQAQGTLESDWEGMANVNWISFNAGPSEVEALFAGDIDIGYIGPVPAITANVKSEGDVQILTGASQAGAILVTAPDSDINSVSDLSGKTVAIPQIGNTQYLCLLQLLADNGLASVENGGTVTVTAVSNADVQNMMEQGILDAALVPEPWGSTLLEAGADMLLDEDQIYMDGDYPVAVVVVRKEFMEEHPDLVETFLAEHHAAGVYINDNTQEAEEIVNEQINSITNKSLSDTVLASSFSRIVFDDTLNSEAIDGFAETCLEQGFISTLPDTNIIIGE